MSITESQARAFLATLHGLPDDRHPVADGDLSPRRVAFERGWKDRARKTYSERSLGRLTWQNLGYRARDAFEGHDPADVFEAFRRIHDADRPAPNAPAPTIAPTGHRPRVYISYARNDGATPTRELAAALTRRGVDVEFDETGIAPGERIRAFMDRLIDGDQIFVVISDASLRSPHCMYELYGIWQRSRRDGDTFLRHVIPLVMPGTRIDRPEDRVAHARHWRQRFRDLETLVRDDLELVGPGDFAECKRMADYARHVGEMLYLIADRLVPRDLAALARADFAPLVDLLRECLPVGPDRNNEQRETHASQRHQSDSLPSIVYAAYSGEACPAAEFPMASTIGAVAAHDTAPQIFCYADHSLDELAMCIAEARPTVLHIDGHGAPQGATLRNGAGPICVSWPVFAQWLRMVASEIQLLVLTQSHSDDAAMILSEWFPMVIGCKGVLWNASADSFTRVFYSRLLRGATIRQAFDLAEASVLVVRDTTKTSSAGFCLYTKTGKDLDRRPLAGG